MKQYRLFFSWQSDLPDVRKAISDYLEEAREALANEEIELIVDQDTRYRSGATHIDNVVMDKISGSDVFVADVTPVTSMATKGKTKLIPNPNVMFEAGIFLGQKGESKLILLAQMEPGQDVNNMPFDINHRRISTFRKGDSLKRLTDWLKQIFVEIDRERDEVVPAHACHVAFADDSDHTVIHPKFRNISYIPRRIACQPRIDPARQTLDAVLGYSGVAAAIAANTAYLDNLTDTVKAAEFKLVKGSVNHSIVPVSLRFDNDGNQALDNCVIHIRPATDGVKFHSTNKKETFSLPQVLSENSLFIDKSDASKRIIEINPSATYEIGDIYLEVPAGVSTIELDWDVTARQLPQGASGRLTVAVENEFLYEDVENDNRAWESEILPHIEDITD